MEKLAHFRRIEDVDLIPSASISVLPFIPEPISEWSRDVDLCEFLTRLCNQDSIMVDAAGREHPVNYAYYGHYLYETGVVDFSRLGEAFSARAREVVPAPTSKSSSKSEIPDFAVDANFGLMAKYAIAWSGAVGAILSEEGFFSIAHTLESEDDARCSIVLASHLYYRQAGQVLRNVIEDVFAQMYFCEDDEAFAKWRSGEFGMPRLRGKGGLLDRLVERSLLPKQTAEEASSLYGKLCSNVHGAEHSLINAGLFTGEATGHRFRYDRFAEWCVDFAGTIDVAIQAQRLVTNRWLEIVPKGRPFCSICHNDQSWGRETEAFAGRRYIKLTCKRCGTTMTLDEARIRTDDE